MPIGSLPFAPPSPQLYPRSKSLKKKNPEVPDVGLWAANCGLRKGQLRREATPRSNPAVGRGARGSLLRPGVPSAKRAQCDRASLRGGRTARETHPERPPAPAGAPWGRPSTGLPERRGPHVPCKGAGYRVHRKPGRHLLSRKRTPPTPTPARAGTHFSEGPRELGGTGQGDTPPRPLAGVPPAPARGRPRTCPGAAGPSSLPQPAPARHLALAAPRAQGPPLPALQASAGARGNGAPR